MAEIRKRKLIEVSLPLEAINRESAREKAIRHGHPSTLHLWWARRPLAACRAVLFAQLVDDPSAHPDEFRTDEEQTRERKRLHELIERLVVWEDANDEALLKEARTEIWRYCGGNPPAILDPFAGGGSIPLEAQRLGLESHASDLNPVAVLINKALIEIPPKWSGRSPVFPGLAENRMVWPGATGLAEDVRRYGQWMRDEAEWRIGHLYPPAVVPGDERPDGKRSADAEATVIAWIWARTIQCPNPACGIQMPLARTWWLGKKKGKEAYVVPSVVDGEVRFSIGHDLATAPVGQRDGTVSRGGAVCVGCGEPVALTEIRKEAKAGRMGAQLMAIAAEGNRRRIYLPPNEDHIKAADVTRPADVPETYLPKQALGFRVQGYGMTMHMDLFTPRQLVALTTFSDLVKEAHDQVLRDAVSAGLPEGLPLQAGGIGAHAYADSVATYLAFAVSKVADNSSNLCAWRPDTGKEGLGHVFARQTLSMVWDYAEGNVFNVGPTDIATGCVWIAKALAARSFRAEGHATQANAADRRYQSVLVATDPPYYDNVGYADLSDFFYVWLRRSLRAVHGDLFSTVVTPKADELVADPFRHESAEQAERFFEEGFGRVFARIREGTPADYPITVFYAFKQAETDSQGEASTGWETLLAGMIRSGWAVTGTWPMRTELGNRMRNIDSNALASSIVLACRPRAETAATTDRRGFIAAMREHLPDALRKLQEGNIAPVDLAQAAIGPGMAIFSGYAHVAEPDGSPMRVRMALALINQVLAEVLTEQEGDLDTESRFALKWFEQHEFGEGKFGDAESLAKAYNTSVDGLERAGIFRARAGRARLIAPEELPDVHHRTQADRLSVWEAVLHLVKRLDSDGIDATGRFLAEAGGRVADLDAVKELAYLLFAICERRKSSKQALRFNNLVASWSDVDRAARSIPPERIEQQALDLDSLSTD